MASFDDLPPDQRAVLQLVLQRERTYDEIARLLSVDRAGVRQRALEALDTLGPQTGVPAQRRALITDYLLGQLPGRVRDQIRDRLAESPSERAWARVLASELAPLASSPLPEIPTEVSRAAEEPEPPSLDEPTPVDEPEFPAFEPPVAKRAPTARSEDQPASGPGRPRSEPLVPDVPDEGRRREKRAGSGPSSRRGGLLLLVLAIIVIVVVVIVLSSGGSTNKPAASHSSHSSTSAASASATSTTSTAAHVIAQIDLKSPTAGSKTAGIAEILKEGASDGIAIVAQNVTPNTTKPANAYAVWLYNSPTDSHILGFVNPGVTSNGRLSTAGGLPANASHYKQLIVTLETAASPKQPGPIILEGTLTGL